MLGDAFPGDVEGCAVVNRRPHEGEPQVGADAFLKTVDLYRYMPLVVIHGQDHVVSPLDGLVEDYVGRHGPGGVYAFPTRLLDRRGDLLRFLASQKAAVTAVGVKGGHPMRGRGTPH